MKYLWTYIDDRKWQVKTKYKVALLILGIAFAAIGFAVWLVVRNWMLSTWDWMLCFLGYPVVLSWFVVLIYSANHDFHQKKKDR